ncbi:MAG: helix-turn-helix transcriptional regulator [Lachnospiraceae bacterium]|nr:helix-turn-helix transcriptional regulator [Lachnospiraceae bacterium]
MNTGEKIARLRKENNYTQEQLAALLGVSRQSVSKYESGVTYPETDKLIRLSELFGCTVDYLLKDNAEEPDGYVGTAEQSDKKEAFSINFVSQWKNFECKSEKIVFGMPLWHIGKNAKGVFAIGIKAKGIVSVGLFSFGLVSFGFCSFGLLAFGLFALGLLSAGCFSLGGLAFGAIAVGIITCGAVAIGEFSIGALAIGHYFALGDHAYGMFAIGDTKAVGENFEQLGEVTELGKQMAVKAMRQEVPKYYQWVVKIIEELL